MKCANPDPRLNTVEVYRRMLALLGYYLDDTSKILEFGCGAGKLVCAFREAGFDAHGFDIHDYLDLPSPNYRPYFQIADKGGYKGDFSLDWTQYRLPYADDTFDFVFSTSVMKHVQNHDAVLRELARVTKPDGVAIHTFPSRYNPIEQHTFVPFGGLTKSRLYYRLWAVLGVRNSFQKDLSAKEVAERNVKYAHTGTNYLGAAALWVISTKYYERSCFDPAVWLLGWQTRGWRLSPAGLKAYGLLNMMVWILEKPRREPVST